MGGTAGKIGHALANPIDFGLSQVGAGAQNAGGGGKGSEAPSVPDFEGAANRQSDESRANVAEQTRANRPDQTGPFGSTQWTQDAQGNWTQNTSLTPGLNDAAQSITSQIGQGSSLDPGQARDQAIQAAYGQATSRLDPQWAQREDQTRTRLANQGLTPGSAAYDAALQSEGQGRNDAYAQAMYGAQTGAGNAAFQQGLNANMQPYQQLQALQGLTQQNNFQTAGQAQTPQLLNALAQAYGGQMQQYGIEQAGKNSQLSGLAGLGAAGIAASDERLKVDVRRSTLEAIPGVPLASWEWPGQPGLRQVGVIAQDLQVVRPDLVLEGPGGYLWVDYGRLHG